MYWFADAEALTSRDDTGKLLPNPALVERSAPMELLPDINSGLVPIDVTMGAEVAFRSAVAATAKVEKGNEVLIPVPAVKMPRPNLTWNTPSAVVFWGPLPTTKSNSFAPHCRTRAASLIMADEKDRASRD